MLWQKIDCRKWLNNLVSNIIKSPVLVIITDSFVQTNTPGGTKLTGCY